MQVFNCFATLVLVGPQLATFAAALLDIVAQHPVRRGDPTPIGASALRDNTGVVFRVAGPSVEGVGRIVFSHLHFVEQLLGECPWSRKW